MGGLKRLWVEGFLGLEVPQGFWDKKGSEELGFHAALCGQPWTFW